MTTSTARTSVPGNPSQSLGIPHDPRPHRTRSGQIPQPRHLHSIVNPYDLNGNHKAHVAMETELSKFLIEHRNFAEWLLPFDQRIDQWLKDHSSEPHADRFIKRYWRQAPVQNDREAWVERTTLYKIFLERVYHEVEPPGSAVTMTPRPLTGQPTDEQNLSCKWLRAIQADPKHDQRLWQKTRCDDLFADHIRGRIEQGGKPRTSRKLGIYPVEQTPKRYLYYFASSREVIQDCYLRDPKSPLIQVFEAHDAPMIAGVSGTMAYVMRALMRMGPFSDSEIRNFLMALAGAMVARGFHSFTEIVLVPQKLGYMTTTKQSDSHYDHLDLCDAVLTDELKASLAYRVLRAELRALQTSK